MHHCSKITCLDRFSWFNSAMYIVDNQPQAHGLEILLGQNFNSDQLLNALTCGHL